MLQDILRHLEALVSFDTRNPPRAITTGGIFDYIRAQLPDFHVEVTDHGAGAVSLLAVRGHPRRLFNVHLDTVAGWQPVGFDGTCFTGRGAIDAKGPAVALLAGVRAARALQQATGCALGVDIELEKRIPAGGGLGGGSSDAASVLLGLNRLWNTGLSRQQLMRLALPLGADVPVFVFGRNAFAEGIGEELTPIELPPRWYVVVQPDASVPTADVFRAPELTRNSPRVKIADFPRGTFDGAFRNDLEPVVFARFSEVGRVATELSQALEGARVRMSGSGSCLFVECDTQAQADSAACKIAAKMQSQPSGLPALRVNQACAGLDAHPLLDWA